MVNHIIDIPWPPHAYVPGQSARHPEDWFDQIKGTVRPGMSAQALAQGPAFAAGMAYLDKGYFWECHEVLEAIWMLLPGGSAERRLVQALIQLANARLKLRMQRPKATLRLCDIAVALLEGLGDTNPIMGVTPEHLLSRVDRTRKAATNDL